jgi:hypothetical protein
MSAVAPEPEAAARAREWGVLSLALALSAALSWARIEFNEIYLPGALENVAGIDPRGAAEPFAHRVLVPRTIRWIVENLAPFATPLAVFRVFDALFVFFAFLATRRLGRETLGSRERGDGAGWRLFPLLGVHYVLSREYPFWYAWDMASVAVFAWGLVFLRSGAWAAYYPLFVLGTFNRETTCFLTFSFLFTRFGSMPRTKLALHCGAQLLLWLAVKWWLRELFRRQPGDVYQSVWRENAESLADPAMWRWYLMAFGGLWLVLPFVWHRIADRWLRAVVFIVPLFALGMFFAGVWSELRIWGELVPVVLLAVLAGLLPREPPAAANAALRTQ